MQQDAEKVVLLTRPTLARLDAPFPMQRARFIEILNVPHRGYASGFDSPAALLDGLFEHPAGAFSCCAARRSSSQAHVRAIKILAY